MSYPNHADPLGSSSYIALATDYISSGLLCTCQELNVLSLFYVHRWVSSPVHLPGAQCSLLVLRPQVNFNSCPVNSMSPTCLFFVHRISCSLLQRKPEEDPHLTEKVAPLLNFWRSLFDQLFHKSFDLSQERCTIFQLCYFDHFFLRWRECFFLRSCPLPLTLSPTSIRSPMMTIVNMETLPLPWKFRWKTTPCVPYCYFQAIQPLNWI